MKNKKTNPVVVFLKVVSMSLIIMLVIVVLAIAYIFRDRVKDFYYTKIPVMPAPIAYRDYLPLDEITSTPSFEVTRLGANIDDGDMLTDKDGNLYIVAYRDSSFRMYVIDNEGDIVLERAVTGVLLGSKETRSTIQILQTDKYILSTIANSLEADPRIEKHLTVSGYRGVVEPLQIDTGISRKQYKAYYDRATVVAYTSSTREKYITGEGYVNITSHFAQMIIDDLPYRIDLSTEEDIEQWKATFEEKGCDEEGITLRPDDTVEDQRRHPEDYSRLGESINGIKFQYFVRGKYCPRPIIYIIGTPPPSHWRGMAYCEIEIPNHKSYTFQTEMPKFTGREREYELPLGIYRKNENYMILTKRKPADVFWDFEGSYLIKIKKMNK